MCREQNMRRYKTAVAHLTTNEVALLIAAATLFGGTVGFLLKRWLTNAPMQERATFLNTVADLGAKLRAHGMSIGEVRSLAAAIQNPSIMSSEAATQIVRDLANEPEPRAFESNYTLKMRAAAARNVAEAKLEQALSDLQLLMGHHEWDAVVKAQQHWNAYRGWLQHCAVREFEGGTHAGLASGLVSLAETERRTDEIRAQVRERSAR